MIMASNFFKYFGIIIAVVGVLFIFLGMGDLNLQLAGFFSIIFGVVVSRIRKK